MFNPETGCSSAISLACFVCLLLILSFKVAAAPRSYELNPLEIAPDVYLLQGKSEHFSFRNGGNIVNTGFIVGKTGVIVIDSGPSRLYGEQMSTAISGITDKPVEIVFITHFHPDHFLGNQGFPDARVVALAETVEGIRVQGELFNDAMYRLVGPWMKGTEVILPETLEYQSRMTVEGRPLELIRFRGHSGSDLAIFDRESGVLFAGDMVFSRRTPTTPHADVSQWIEELDQFDRTPFRILVPGHGPVVEKTVAVRQTRGYLAWLQDSLRQMAEKGLSMAEALIPLESGKPFFDLAVFGEEYQRSIAHLFPAIEQQALARGKVKQAEP